MAELKFPLQQRHFMSYIKVEMLRLKNMNQNSCQKEINKKKTKQTNNIRCFRPYYRRQRGGFLSRYDFAYAGRDIVNQAAKQLNSIAPRLIKQASREVNRLGRDRI